MNLLQDSVLWALFAAFIDAQLLFNWIQFLRYQSYILPSKRNFPGKTSFLIFCIAKAKLDRLVMTKFDGFFND